MNAFPPRPATHPEGAACDSGPTVIAINGTQKEVGDKIAAATGSDVMVSPGRWEGVMTM